METIAKVRRMYFVHKKGFKTIARELKLSKNTVKNVIKSKERCPRYSRQTQPYKVLGNYIGTLESKLAFDKSEPSRRKRTAKKLYDESCAEGYQGSYEAVNNFVKAWRLRADELNPKVFVPLEFPAGEAFQFDWSEEEIELDGKLTRIKAAHIRLSHSRFFLVVTYPNEQLEMVMDAHDKAFTFFDGCCQKGIYDNMKTAVKKILIGKEREFNPRFMELASHHLFEPVACTPRSGWEKGQVENQVLTVRRNFFTPLVRVKSLDELNHQLEQDCLAWAKKSKHPERKDVTVWEVYQQEKPALLPLQDVFNGYKLIPTTVSPTSLIHYDTNAYSVDCQYVRKAVEVRAYAKRVLVYYEDKLIAEHSRSFERNSNIYNPYHYVLVLERKPGALRNGAPFKEWVLPDALEKVRFALSQYSDGDKQFISVLLQIQAFGLDAVNNACSKALSQGISQAAIIITYLTKQVASEKPAPEISRKLSLKHPPSADCSAYNQLTQGVLAQQGVEYAR